MLKPTTKISRLVVLGDSLSDRGTLNNPLCSWRFTNEDSKWLKQ